VGKKYRFCLLFFINLHLIIYTLNLGKLNLAILKGQEPAVSQILESFNSLNSYATFFLVGGSIFFPHLSITLINNKTIMVVTKSCCLQNRDYNK
jgi:hypothetical protein